LNGLAFAIACALLIARRIGRRAAYSALLPSTILLWAYLHAMQYIVIWSGNIPDEAVWYLKRSEDGWQFALLVLAVGQFVFPFFALLSQSIRADRRWLFALCALTLVMRVLEASILVLPAEEYVAPLTTGVMLLPAVVFLSATLWWTFTFALGEEIRVSLSPRRARAKAESESEESAR
jgi:hypothetical protein